MITEEAVGIMADVPAVMEGPAPRRAAQAAPEATVRKRQLPGAMPSMRSAVVWAEILGKPKALKGRR